MPWRSSTRAVPAVATRLNPISTSRRASEAAARLSRLLTDTKILPDVGRIEPLAICDLR